jgi:hypothetical protein
VLDDSMQEVLVRRIGHIQIGQVGDCDAMLIASKKLY